RVECRRLCCRKIGVDRPVFFLFERLDFAFALNDEAQRNCLHAAGGEAAPNLVPQQWRNLITDEAIEDAPGLLRMHEILIDVPRMLEGLTNGALRDLVK